MDYLTCDTYLKAFRDYGILIQGGTIHDFIRESQVIYYNRKCPCYQIEYFWKNKRAVIGGFYATNYNKNTKLYPNMLLDF